MKTALLFTSLLALLVSSCVVHHRRHRRHRRHRHHHPPAATVEVRTPPPPPPRHHQPPPPRRTHQPPPPPREPAASSGPRRHRAPPAPSFRVQLNITRARRGQEVILTVVPDPGRVGMIYYNGRPMARKETGGTYIVTLPGDARSGHFEVEHQGQRFRSPFVTITN